MGKLMARRGLPEHKQDFKGIWQYSFFTQKEEQTENQQSIHNTSIQNKFQASIIFP